MSQINVLKSLTSSSLAWIKACTFFAIICQYTRSTTSSTIPSTSTIVVVVITPAIFCPMRGTTATSTFHSSTVVWVTTFAFFAILGIYIIPTTISTIPLTSTIVVYIITISITFPTLPITSICATRRWCWRGSTCISNLRYLERFKFQPHSEISNILNWKLLWNLLSIHQTFLTCK